MLASVKPQFAKSTQIFRYIEQGLTLQLEKAIDQDKNSLLQVSELLRLGPDKNPYDLNPLEAAVLIDNPKIINILLKHINPGENASLCLAIAAGNGSMATVNLLLADTRVCPANSGRMGPTNEALCWAIHFGKHNQQCNLIALRLLEEPKVEPNASWNRAILTAASCGNTYMLKFLTEFNEVDCTVHKGLSMNSALANEHYPTAVALYTHLTRKHQDPYIGLDLKKREQLQSLVVSYKSQLQAIKLLASELTQENDPRPNLPLEVVSHIFCLMYTGSNRVMEDRDIIDLTTQLSKLQVDKTIQKTRF